MSLDDTKRFLELLPDDFKQQLDAWEAGRELLPGPTADGPAPPTDTYSAHFGVMPVTHVTAFFQHPGEWGLQRWERYGMFFAVTVQAVDHEEPPKFLGLIGLAGVVPAGTTLMGNVEKVALPGWMPGLRSIEVEGEGGRLSLDVVEWRPNDPPQA